MVDPEFIFLQVISLSELNIETMRRELAAAPGMSDFDEKTADKVAGLALVAAHAGIAALKEHPGDEIVSAWNDGLLALIFEANSVLKADNFGDVLNHFFGFVGKQFPKWLAEKPGQPESVANVCGAYFGRQLVKLNT